MFKRSLFLPLLILSLSCTLLFSACRQQTANNPPATENNNSETLKLLYWQAPTILNPHLSTGFKDSEASRITLEPLASFDEKGELVPFLAAEIPTIENGGAHLYEKYSNETARQAPANLLPVGTGPYKVVEFKPGDTAVYEPNSFFREADKLGFQRIELKGGGDATSAARAVLQTQEADYAYNLQVEAKVLSDLEKAGRGQLISSFGSLIERVLFNLSDPNQVTPEGERSSIKFPHPFLSDVKVREALSLAVDRDTIATQLYGITGKTTPNFIVMPSEYNSPNTRYEFNLEKANKLLDDAGWKDSNGDGTRDKNGVEMKLVFQTTVNPLRQKTQEIIKQSLQAIGVGVELKTIDASIFFSSDPANDDTVEKFYADLQMYTTGNNSPDPKAYFKTFTCSEIPQKADGWAGDNYARYCNPEYDKLWQAFSQELKPEKRREIAIKMNDMLINNFVIIPLVHRADVVAISNSLSGFKLTPWDRNTWNIKDWKRSK